LPWNFSGTSFWFELLKEAWARSGGTTELIREGFNGLLYTPGNYKELAEKILHLHRHPDLAKKMGDNGQRWAAEYFTEERYGEEVLTILKQILE
jgi:glycosyltransferase involved in cell wall biosynthesis